MQSNNVEVMQNSAKQLIQKVNASNDKLNRLWERLYEEKERYIKANIKMYLLVNELDEILYANEEACAQISYFLGLLEE